VICAYLQVLMLIGSRREELAGLKWEDVDFRWRSITIHDKVEGERTIPLTPYVASLLACLPRRNEWVFSSPAASSGRLSAPCVQHHRACTIAGIEDMTLHGLRRSFATLSEWTEVPTGVVAQIMGHKPSATAERHYKVRSLDLLRMWHTKIEAWILSEAGTLQPAEDARPGLRAITTAWKRFSAPLSANRKQGTFPCWRGTSTKERREGVPCMNVVVFINGREAIPVRALPFVAPDHMSPDAIVRLLGHADESGTFRQVFAYQLLPHACSVRVQPPEWSLIAYRVHAGYCGPKKAPGPTRTKPPIPTKATNCGKRKQAQSAEQRVLVLWLLE
jgi:hypothetical protein